jgi:hypothetical protein
MSSGCCKRVLYAMCLGLKSTAEGNAGDNNDDDTPLIDLKADPWRTIRKREIKADQKELVAEIMRRFLAYHNNSVGRLPPRATYYSVTKCIQWLLDRPITLLADVLFLRNETNRYRQTMIVARTPPVAPMDDDDDDDDGENAVVSAVAAHNNGTNTISAAEEYYTASGCCKRVLFAMCLGLTKNSTADNAADDNDNDDDDTPLIYLEVDPWRTVRKSEIKAGRKELAAEIQRRSLTYHPADQPPPKLPRVSSYSVTKCIQWLLDHPIPFTTDVLFLRHETNRYRRTIHVATTTMVRRSHDSGRDGSTVITPRQHQAGLHGAAAAVAPREEEGGEALPVATTNHHHSTMIPPTTNQHPTVRVDNTTAHDDDDDDDNNNNDNTNIAAAAAVVVAPDATAAHGGSPNADSTLPAAAAATNNDDRLARRQSPCPDVNDSSSSSSDDSYDDYDDENGEDDDDLRRRVVAMVTAVSALIGTRRRRRRDRQKSRRLLYVRQRLDQLRDQCREYRRIAVLATTDDAQEYKAFCDREVASMTKEMEDLQQERERLKERSKKKQKTRHNET